MIFKPSIIIILVFIFATQVSAEEPKIPAPAIFNVINNKDYYHKSYGYNMKESCKGSMCIPAGSEVGCASYDYKKGGARGTKLQVCNISTIKNTQLGTSIDLSNEKYTMVTGIIDKEGKFSHNLPIDEIYISTFWRTLRYEPKAEKVAEVKQPDSSNTTIGGVCLPGHDCEKIVNCENKGLINTLKCMKQMVALPAPPSFLFPGEVEDDESIDPKFDRKIIAAAFNKQGYAEKCDGFITNDGSLGPWGKEGVKSFKEVCKECFYGDKSVDVKNICPKFKKFSDTQKDYFWTWTLAAIAHPESSCKTNVRVKGTRVKGHQEYAVGLLQLEESMHRRRGRGPACRSGLNLTSPRFQFMCAASIIKDTRWDEGKPLAGGSGQYWQKLHALSGKRGKISQYISKFPGCR